MSHIHTWGTLTLTRCTAMLPHSKIKKSRKTCFSGRYRLLTTLPRLPDSIFHVTPCSSGPDQEARTCVSQHAVTGDLMMYAISRAGAQTGLKSSWMNDYCSRNRSVAVCTLGELRPIAGSQDGVSHFTYLVIVVMTKSEATFKVTSLRKCAQHQLHLGILFVSKKKNKGRKLHHCLYNWLVVFA